MGKNGLMDNNKLQKLLPSDHFSVKHSISIQPTYKSSKYKETFPLGFSSKSAIVYRVASLRHITPQGYI